LIVATAGMFVAFIFGGMAEKTKQQARQLKPCAEVASLADRYELRESGVVGLLVRLDKQTGETTPISAIPAR
jgi:hypothetical protein